MSDQNASREKQGSQPRVLVVENDEDYRYIHFKNLTQWGYEVYVAQGLGQELINDAVDTARRRHCHFAVIDLRLSDDYNPADISGLEVMKIIKPTESVIYSGLNDYKLAQDALKAGALAYIAKSDMRMSLQNELSAAAKKRCFSKSEVDISWDGGLSSPWIMHAFFPDDELVPLDEVDDLLVRLFSNLENGDSRLQTLHLTPMNDYSEASKN